MPTCIAIRRCGVQCTTPVAEPDIRCPIHAHSLMIHGPNKMARLELSYVHKAEIRAIGPYPTLDQKRIRVYTQRLHHEHEMNELFRQQTLERLRTHVDPDEPARQYVAERRQRQREAREERWVEAAHEMYRGEIYLGGRAVVQLDPRNLGEIAEDNQGVHTAEVVEHTKRLVELVRRVAVPEGYKWSPTEMSKTPYEIGMECRLSPAASSQMVTQYALDTAIYDIEPGIYGKTLDAVWSYVKTSPDKEDLKKIIKQELEDNIGMCAQGNLTRICNILAGYIDGVGVKETKAELLGRLLAPLREIADERNRVRMARSVLDDHGVPQEEWDMWTDALLD